jgi:hypothetical protein
LKGTLERGKHTKINFNVFCDTGSIPETFISRDLVKKLNLIEYASRSKSGLRTVTGEVIYAFKYVKLNNLLLEYDKTMFKDNMHGIQNMRVRNLKLYAKVLDGSPYDLILGYKHMFKFQVSTIFSHLFSSTKDSSNSVMEIVNDNNVDEETPSATESAQQSVADRTA